MTSGAYRSWQSVGETCQGIVWVNSRAGIGGQSEGQHWCFMWGIANK